MLDITYEHVFYVPLAASREWFSRERESVVQNIELGLLSKR